MSGSTNTLSTIIHDGFVPRLTAAFVVSVLTFVVPALAIGIPSQTVFEAAFGVAHGWFWAALAALTWRDKNNV